MTPAAKDATEKIIALKELSRKEGMVTTRAQQKVFRSLSDEDMADVALFFRRLNAAGITQVVALTPQEEAELVGGTDAQPK
jgi:hypothetical protein